MQELLLYGLPSVIFFIVCLIMYKIDEDKKDKKTNYVKILLPSIISSIVIFGIIKYQTVSEPMMMGNYFD